MMFEFKHYIYAINQADQLMYRKIYYFILLCLIIGINSTSAQSYGAALGLRLGDNNFSRTVGLTGKYRILKHVTLEGIAQTDFSRNTTFHFLIEQHQSILSKRLNFYIGTGVGFGEEESEIKDPQTKQIIYTYGNPTFGIDLIAGIEFTLLRYSLSLDYKPNFNLWGREQWVRGQIGLSLRYVMITGAAQNKNRRKRAREKRKEEAEGLFPSIKNFFTKPFDSD